MIVDAQHDMEVVAEAADGDEAVSLTHSLTPNVVLMDIRMPVTNGLVATERIVAAGLPEVRVLVLTTFDLDEYVYEAIRVGASGFLAKDTPPDDLVHAIRTVAAGNALLGPAVLRRLLDEYVSRPPPSTGTPVALAELTAREIDVLKQVARGLSNAEIAAELFLGENTVKSHVTHVLQKLQVRDRVQAVVKAYESGLVTPGRD